MQTLSQSLEELVKAAAGRLTEIIIDRPTQLTSILKAEVRDGRNVQILDHTVTIPRTVSIRITRSGRIDFPSYIELPSVGPALKLEDPALKIEGGFEAGCYQVFHFPDDGHYYGKHDKEFPVVFCPGSVKEVLACWFGALPGLECKPTAKYDAKPAIQRAIYSAYQVSRVHIPAGQYCISDTLHLDLPLRALQVLQPWIGYVFEGTRSSNFTSKNNKSNITTQIYAEFGDRPAINIGLARDTAIRSISLIGKNEKPSAIFFNDDKRSEYPAFYANAERCGDNILPQDWIQEEWPDSQPQNTTTLDSKTKKPITSGRYNPYCGIATDAYGYNPQNEQYGDSARYMERENPASGCSGILLEGVEIKHFVAAVAISPSGVPQNDLIRIQRSLIHKCAYGISIGTTQARGVHIKENLFLECHTAITNVTFGEQLGGSQINCSSNVYVQCRNLYQLATSHDGPAHLSGEYAEALVQLGHFGIGGNVGTSGAPTVLTGCSFNFGVRTKTMRLLASQANTTFIGCDFTTYGDQERSKDFHFLLTSDCSRLVFQSCSFHAVCSTTPPRFFATQYADWSKISFRDCTMKVNSTNESTCSIYDKDNKTNEKRDVVVKLLSKGEYVVRRVTENKQALDPKDQYVETYTKRDKNGNRVEDYIPSDGEFPEYQPPTLINRVDVSLSAEQTIDLRGNEYPPHRVYLNMDARMLHVRYYVLPYQSFQLKHTLPVQPFLKVNNLRRLSNSQDAVYLSKNGRNQSFQEAYDFVLVFDQVHEGEFLVGDRIYFDFYLEEYPASSGKDNGKFPANHMPILEVEIIDSLKVYAAIPEDFRREVRLPRENPIFDPSSRKEMLLEDGVVSEWRLQMYPRLLNQPFTIINGSVSGEPKKGDFSVIENVTNMHLLRVGDFINADFGSGIRRVKELIGYTVMLSQSTIQDPNKPNTISGTIVLAVDQSGFTVQGKNIIGTKEVTDVENIHLLNEGQDLKQLPNIAKGTKINKIRGQLRLTSPVQFTSLIKDIPAIIAKES